MEFKDYKCNECGRKFSSKRRAYCLKNYTKKISIRNGIQRYKCNECGRKFSSKRRARNLQEIIFNKKVYL